MIKAGNKYEKIKVEETLDLEKIAQRYGMATDELLRFHNQHCKLHELLTLTLPKYTEFLYIPHEVFEKYESKLLKNSTLTLPDTDSSKVYGVVIKFLPKDIEIHYKIRIKRTQNSVEITKEKTYVNNQEVDKIVEQIFEKAEQVLYPLHIITDSGGDIIKISNAAEIAKRWTSDQRPKMKEYYVSEVADALLKQLDHVFKDINAKNELLSRNIFYKLFFLPVYKSYPHFSKRDLLQFYFPGIPREASYEVQYTLEQYYTRGNKIILRIEGEEEGNLMNENLEKGKVDLHYKLHKDTREIFSIEGTISVIEKGKEYKTELRLYEQHNS
ncbi:hypothetical protein KRE47_02560 [Elizabethkingia meningoseptica]|uniref:hypothetical protein n=1 Tax=Elizabethkingia meningoseptica TaxID=238 RepID=UPI0022F18988|nr:hypothetical protein [Elizabethkingia meningoseptica]EJK5327304.1 hypothetical protein [Elizabethkingia meningoseptica]MDE5466939.1 hypothetical protein [Elizabethkingia meningoseptica]MDE5473831.1 hypothetical protein [Elizabethkingia meningoseptica]MDE5477264.1 hypothetical protein [Elizabethkingia meningoseptica]MDE5484258.1 hypothetical protein [Elizabethkingia meningoseptica]